MYLVILSLQDQNETKQILTDIQDQKSLQQEIRFHEFLII